ncbi:MAG TPA: RNA 2',3'-cyclic phosphodiesterase [Gemmatimonadales bacterium]|nr:RNA 2',3'-cyclic phosphodiesterase [Gemmatimonadales bacterium]
MRLFLAINFPADVRTALWQSIEPLIRKNFPIKWVGVDQLHLSLKFLGDVEAERLPEMKTASGRAVQGTRPLTLAVGEGGFGAFPDLHRPRVVWAAVTAEPALELLQHRVEQEFGPLGFPPEGRPFRPHITLGRATRNAAPGDFGGLEAELSRLAFSASVVADRLDLMESTLQRSGAVYQVVHHERLS